MSLLQGYNSDFVQSCGPRDPSPVAFPTSDSAVGRKPKRLEAIWHFKLDAILFFAANTFFAFGAPLDQPNPRRKAY